MQHLEVSGAVRLIYIYVVRQLVLSIQYFSVRWILTFRHHASCILGQAFHYSPENAFYILNQQIYFII